jgi:hypothetical protein
MSRNRVLAAVVVSLLLGVGGYFFWQKERASHSGPGSSAGNDSRLASPWDVARIESDAHTGKISRGPDRVFFKNGTMIDNLGFDLKFLGKLKAEENPPVLLFSGRECVDCEEGLNFYVYSLQKSSAIPYSYPAGKVSSEEDGGVFYQGRGFFGKCFSDGQEGVIAFGSLVQSDGSWKKVVTSYSFQPDGTFVGKEVDAEKFTIEDTLKKVLQGTCQEMPQQDYSEG